MGHSIVSPPQLVIVLTLFWATNLTLIALVGSGLSQRFKDPSLSTVSIYWASFSCFIALTLVTDYHELIYFSLFTIIVFGVFSLQPQDFRRYSLLIMAAQLIQSGAANVLGSSLHSTAEIIAYVLALGVAIGILGQLCQSISVLRQRLKQRNSDLQKALVAKDQFLANMSHELRTPMNGVLGMLEMLRSNTTDNTQSRYIDIAQSSGNTLISLINDILDYSKIREGKLILEQRLFCLTSALQNLATVFYIQARQKQVEIIIDIDPCLPAQVIGDELRILQILNNFISNAIKFTQQGTVTIRIEMRQRDGHDELHCQVADTGIGINPAALESIFNQFTQADNATTRDYGGTGLGLSIAKRLIELMNGQLSVESKEGAGSTFSFYIQLAGNSKPQQRDLLLANYHVDLIDDLAAHHNVMQRYFQSLGAEVSSHQNSALLNLKDLVNQQHPSPRMIAVHLHNEPPQAKLLTPKIIDAAQSADIVWLLIYSGTQPDINMPAICIEKPVDFVTLYEAIDAFKNTALNENTTKTSIDKPLTIQPDINTDKPVLIIEDNLINQQVTGAMVKKLGLNSELANNGADALALLNKHPERFCLILMDCQTPIMDGYTATKAIREGRAGEANKHIPIIALTASALTGDRERCLAAGMSDYLPKPCDFSTLKTTINRHLQAITT